MKSYHHSNIRRVIEFIESNLTSPIRIENIASEGYMSQFHFYRIFHEITGLTPSEYIRFRRLSEAARDLVEKNCPILHLALKYGYSSQEAFSRAFSRLFQMTPGQYRKRLPKIPLYSKSHILGLSSHQRRIKLEGRAKLVKNLVLKPSKRIIAIRNPEPDTYRQSYESDFFDKCVKTLSNIVGSLSGLFGFLTFKPQLNHFIGVEVDSMAGIKIPEGIESCIRKASYYLVFHHKQNSWKQHDAVVNIVREASAEWQGTATLKPIIPRLDTPLYEIDQENIGFSNHLPVQLLNADSGVIL